MEDEKTTRPLWGSRRTIEELYEIPVETQRCWERDPDLDYPRGVRLTARTVRWRLADIEAWIQRRAQEGAA